jgi:group I intron endonuclease
MSGCSLVEYKNSFDESTAKLYLPEGVSALFSWTPPDEVPDDAKHLTRIVYVLQSPSGKQYVGITKRTFSERSISYKYITPENSYCQKQTAIRNAILKYGWENFYAGILFVSDDEDIEKLGHAEMDFIEKLGTMRSGYNLTSGGESTGCGGFISEETRERMRASSKIQWEDQTRRENHSKKIKKLWEEDQEFAKLSTEATKRRWQVPGEKDKMSDRMRASWMDEEYRTKMSDMTKTNWENSEYRTRVVDSIKERWKDKDYREHMVSSISEKANTRWTDEEWKKARVEKMKREAIFRYKFAYYLIEGDEERRIILSDTLHDSKIYNRVINHFQRRGNDVPWTNGKLKILRRENPMYAKN